MKTIIRILSFLIMITISSCTTDNLETGTIFNPENQLTTDIISEPTIEILNNVSKAMLSEVSIESTKSLDEKTNNIGMRSAISSNDDDNDPSDSNIPKRSDFELLSATIEYDEMVSELTRIDLRNKYNVIKYTVVNDFTEIWYIYVKKIDGETGDKTKIVIESEPDIDLVE